MDVQVKAGSVVRTNVDRKISGMVGKIVSQLQSEMTSVVSNFLTAGISAAGMKASYGYKSALDATGWTDHTRRRKQFDRDFIRGHWGDWRAVCGQEEEAARQ